MKVNTRLSKALKRMLKILGIVTAVIVGILLLVILLIRLPSVQNKIVDYAEGLLKDKLSTELSISGVYLNFPKTIEVSGFYIEDQKGDTLLYFNSLNIDAGLWGLLSQRIDINTIALNELVANLDRGKNEQDFNYQFVVDAFATQDTTTSNPKDSSVWQFSIGDINITSLDFELRDSTLEQYGRAKWQELEIAVNEFDINQSRIDVDDIGLSNADISFTTSKLDTSSSKNESLNNDTSSQAFEFTINEISIDQTNISYQNPKQMASAKLGELSIEIDNIDLPSTDFSVDLIALSESTVSYEIMDFSERDTTSGPKVSEPNPFSFSLKKLKLDDNAIYLKLDSTKQDPSKFDPNHLAIERLYTRAQDITYGENEIAAEISRVSFISDKKPVSIEGAINFDPKSLLFETTEIRVGQSAIDFEFSADYSSLQQVLEPSTEFELNIDEAIIYPSDISYFMPEQKLPSSFKEVSINSSISGSLDELAIEKLQVSTLESDIQIKADIQNVLEPNELYYELDQFSLSSNQEDISRMLPDSINMPVNLPSDFNLKINGLGTSKSFAGDINLISSYGDLFLSIDSVFIQDSIPTYDLSAKSERFNFGTLLDLENNLDSLQFYLRIDGSGADPSNLNVKADGRLESIRWNDHVYDSLLLDVDWSKTLIDATISIRDEALQMRLSADADITKDNYGGKLRLDLDSADLEAMNFSNTPLLVSGLLNTDFSTKDFKRFSGELAIRKFSANNDIDTYRVDSLIVASIDQDDRTEITITSDILEGEFAGNVDLMTVGDALKKHISQYYELKNVPEGEFSDSYFEFYFDLKNTDLLTEIILPELDSFDPGYFKGTFDSRKEQLDLGLLINEFTYTNVQVDSVLFESSSSSEAFESNLSVSQITSGNIAVNNLLLKTELADNLLTAIFSLEDSIARKKYLLKGLLNKKDSLVTFRLDDDSVILNYEPWQVSQNRALLLNGMSDQPVKLELTHDDQRLVLQNTAMESNLRVAFDQFQLATLGKILSNDSEFLMGELNGEIIVDYEQSAANANADVTIENLRVMKRKWGDFNLALDGGEGSQYQIDIALISKLNDISIDALYDVENPDALSVNATIGKFQLETLAPLVSESVQDLKGIIQGKIALDGPLAKPEIDGRLTFNEVQFRPTALNNTLSIDQETLQIKNSQLKFDRFELDDQSGNSAIINGSLEVVTPSFFNLDLVLDVDDFLVLNTTKDDNEQFYGKVRTDGRVVATGSTARPNIDVDLRLTENSDFTYVIPKSEYNAISTENVVYFVDPDSGEEIEEEELIIDTLDFQGVNLTTTLEIDKSTVFNIIIDPITDDKLTVQGAATLNLEIDRKGDIVLSGRYTVEQGSYNFSFYKLLKREFILEKGSSITWTGNPFEARLDLTAYNRVEAPPIDLMINQISNASNQDLEQYKQRLPFFVYLNIDGNLEKPDISFELDMPVEEQDAFGGTVYARIQELNTNESDLNKQVFALLLLKRFISDDPLVNEGGYTMEDRARRSVSRILSDQLQRLTDNVEGIELNVGIESYQDYSNGSAQNTTELELGVSKTLFSDRLEVRIAGNVPLEGENRQEKVSSYVGDLVLEYKLTEDGRLRITGFRQSDFDVLDGEVIETGAGIIYVRDYNAFKELFKSVGDE